MSTRGSRMPVRPLVLQMIGGAIGWAAETPRDRCE